MNYRNLPITQIEELAALDDTKAQAEECRRKGWPAPGKRNSPFDSAAYIQRQATLPKPRALSALGLRLITR